MTLLIVDDEARIRSLIAKYASFEGYGTDEAENGMQAVQKCREKKYDLIIMDVMMPEPAGRSMTGSTALKSAWTTMWSSPSAPGS